MVNYVRRHGDAVGSREKSGVGSHASSRPITIPPTPPHNSLLIPDIVASFQQAAVDILVKKTIRAAKAKKVKWIALAGGVSANSSLRAQLSERAEEEGLKISIPPMSLCTDNAAMIGSAAFYLNKKNKKNDLGLGAVSTLRI